MWMKKLAQHYEKMRSIYPSDRLIVLFDIDGTILDMRHMVLSVLYSYDRMGPLRSNSIVDIQPGRPDS